jgi:sugar phosphate isomerase/epimerase
MLLAMTTYGYLHRLDLRSALRDIADAGYRGVEISTAPPHIFTPSVGLVERSQLRHFIAGLGLTCTSLNAAELNLISPNPDISDLARRHYIDNIRLAHDLEVDLLVIVPGRQNILCPTPHEDAVYALERQLEYLLEEAEKLGVRLALETSPYGFMQAAEEVKEVVARFANRFLGIAVDCANVFAVQDPADAVRASADYLIMAQISDTWKDRFAHTSIGRGQVDFGTFASALAEVHYAGPTVYELVDGDDPAPRVREDRAVLLACGWE